MWFWWETTFEFIIKLEMLTVWKCLVIINWVSFSEIIYETGTEGDWAILTCPRSVEGKVTWSREINGSKVDILTNNGDRDQRFNDPQKRYSSTADKSLFIFRLFVSDSGTYYCNNEPAAELTVIPSGNIRLC